MFLYNLTLQRPSAIYFAVQGSFSAPRAIEMVLGRQSALELIRPDEQGTLQSICYQEIYGIIRSIAAFRLTGAKRDYLLVASDSGKITVLVFHQERQVFERVHMETFGKSGCRRIVPGEYIATDPKGRACMIGAVEKQKFVYVFNRDTAENLTISSPLEAHKASFICYGMIGLDVGFENPIFACLERAYDPMDSPKLLVFYELDLGLNHVVRKLATPVDMDTYLILPVPSGMDGPGGVLVCSYSSIRYKSLQPNKEDWCSHWLLREQVKELSFEDRRGNLIISYALHRQKGLFFYLLSTELGDLLKLEMEWSSDENGTIDLKEMRLRYLDTLPAPANAICILRNGFLFVASEYGNHGFYQFRSLGREQDPHIMAVIESQWRNNTNVDNSYSIHQSLENLFLVEEMESLVPLTCLQNADTVGENATCLIVGCGRGDRGAWKTLRLGYPLVEMAVSELFSHPIALFTVKQHQNDIYDAYIIVSFINASLILQVGETVEEVSNSGFLQQVSTIFAQLFANDSFVQVYSHGIRHIRPDLETVHEWKPPQDISILTADGNSAQLVVILSNYQMLYFELDETGMLVELEEVSLYHTTNIEEEMNASQQHFSVSVAPLVKGQSKASFVALTDGTSCARLYSLKKSNYLKPISLQALESPTNSILLIWLSSKKNSQLVLFIGLMNGTCVRANVDAITGALGEQRSRFVGTKPVQLQRLQVHGGCVALILSSHSYLVYLDNQSLLQTTPLSYGTFTLENATGLTSEPCPHGLVASCGANMCILSLEEDLFQNGHLFHSMTYSCSSTPRKLISVTSSQYLIGLESDQRRYVSLDAQQSMIAPPGHWTNCLRALCFSKFYQNASQDEHPYALQCIHELNSFSSQEHVTSLCCVSFMNEPNTLFLCVAVVMGYSLQATNAQVSTCTSIYPRNEVRVYRLDTLQQWEWIHTTVIDTASQSLSNAVANGHDRRNEIMTCMASFEGHLLVAIGRCLRMYDLGKKQLLKKTEHRQATPNRINYIETQYDRIFLGDVQESVFLYRYSAADNLFILVADDYLPRWISSMCLLDYDTIGVGDKFGNLCILRLPPEAGSMMEQDPTGGLLSKTEAPHKFQVEACFHVGSVINGLCLVEWSIGDTPLLIYTTLDGLLGVMIPLRTTMDMELFQSLELFMRNDRTPLCGRHHLAYRSYFFPVYHVIDGDFCEEFHLLGLEEQEKIAKEIDRPIQDIYRKLEDYRERIRYSPV